jgi:hypothetical protein
MEAGRLYEYRVNLMSESDSWNAAHTDERLSLYAQYRRAQDVYQAKLIPVLMIVTMNPSHLVEE